jgi:hypothetical protein
MIIRSQIWKKLEILVQSGKTLTFKAFSLKLCSQMKHKAMIEKASVVFPCNGFQHTNSLHADLKYTNELVEKLTGNPLINKRPAGTYLHAT